MQSLHPSESFAESWAFFKFSFDKHKIKDTVLFRRIDNFIFNAIYAPALNFIRQVSSDRLREILLISVITPGIFQASYTFISTKKKDEQNNRSLQNMYWIIFPAIQHLVSRLSGESLLVCIKQDNNWMQERTNLLCKCTKYANKRDPYFLWRFFPFLCLRGSFLLGFPSSEQTTWIEFKLVFAHRC